MGIRTSVENEIRIVDIAGELDTNTALDAEAHLTNLMDQVVSAIIVGVEKLEYIGSVGLRVFLAMSKRLKSEKGSMVICNLNETVGEVFDISGFRTIFNVTASLDQAVKAL